MRKFLIGGMLAMALALVGCGREVVPPAAKGKILSGDGYSVDVKETGKYWLYWWEDMVLLDTSTKTVGETVTVKMADDLDLTFQVRFRTRIHGDAKVINAMFNDITHEDYWVTLPTVYSVYGRDVVTNVARTVVGKYETKDVSKNYGNINIELQAALRKAMEGSPLEVSNVTVANISWPKVITDAIEARSERELAIETEANSQAVKMVEKKNELELAQADYEIRMTKARAIRDENKVTAEGMNPMLLEYKRLETLETLGKAGNSVMIPVEGLVNPAMQLKLLGK
tara:strand:- start:1099 stop:1950 length:852 start_codon:yes stop_codon:yes gene_type:complete